MGRLAPRHLVVFAVLAALPRCSEPIHVERRWAVMGTYASARVYAGTEGDAERVLDEIRAAFERVDASMSNWKDDSELSRLNREAGQRPFVVRDPDLLRCIRMSLEYARATRGAFDPTVGPLMRAYGFRPLDPAVPDDASLGEALAHVGWEKVEIVDDAHAVRFEDEGVEIDLGGIAKGYALDVAARGFARAGVSGALIGLGGDLYAWRHPPGRETWTIGVRDPEDPSRIMASVELANRAISTSGDYEQRFIRDGTSYGHIMAPKSGRPATSNVVSATALADGGADADALSTAMFVAGSASAAEYLKRARRVEAILLVEGREGRTLLVSASLEGKIEVDPEFASRIGGRVRYLLPPRALDPG